MEKYENYYQKLLLKIKNKDHKQDLINYITIREAVNKIGVSTKANDTTAIYHLSRFLENKPFDKVIQDDLMNWEKWLTEQKYKQNTILLMEAKIKNFFKYISDKSKYKKSEQDQKEIEFPECVKWIKTTKNKGLPITNILDSKQIKKLLGSCKDTREQVIIVSLLDGGLRISELINLRIENIHFNKKLGANFIIPISKTEQRKVQLFLIPSSTLYIREYLNHHPRKDDPEAYFIHTDCQRFKLEDRPNMPITDSGIWKIVKKIGRLAGLKGVHPHYLRHMSATMCCAKGFTEPMLRSRFGWSRSSTMPSHYVHLVSADTDNFIKKILGIKDEEHVKDVALANVICWNCGHENPCSHKFCGRCSANLKPKKEEITPTAIDTGIVTQDALKDPDFREFYNDMLAKTWKMYKEMKGKQGEK